MEAKTIFLSFITVVGTAITTLLGGWDMSIKILLVAMLIDWITGIVAAKIMGIPISSNTGIRGGAKKVFILALVSIAYMIDLVMNQNIVRTAAIIYYTGHEFWSIAENAKKMNIPLPKILVDSIEGLTKKGESKSENSN